MIADTQHLQIRLAHSEHDLRGAQRLRYAVFVEELGATGDLIDHEARLERDEFDAHVDHLILVDPKVDPESHDHVVGLYRLMTSDAAARLGRYYSEGEYDLSPLTSSGRKLLELGRSCLKAHHRGGTGMYLLWNALARYVEENDIEVMFGVASFHGTDPKALAQPLGYLHHRHLAPEDLRVRSRISLAMDQLAEGQIDRVKAIGQVPALIKAYLRLGGYVGEGAYVDHAFNTTDVCLVLDRARMSDRQKSIYSGSESARLG